jgi:hypothetical protein
VPSGHRTRALFATATIAVVGILAAAGCGSKAGTSTPTTAASSSGSAALEKAGPNPSISAKMVCNEAKPLIATNAIGFDTTQPLHPTWNVQDHIYACDYVYSGGAQMRLSVKEMSSPAETTAYFDSLQQQYDKTGKTTALSGLGEGSFQAPDGSVVVRKDNRVLLIDVSKLPAKFGIGSAQRSETAVSVAATVMGCWTGA